MKLSKQVEYFVDRIKGEYTQSLFNMGIDEREALLMILIGISHKSSIIPSLKMIDEIREYIPILKKEVTNNHHANCMKN